MKTIQNSGFSPFDEMQKAVDIVNTSPHPANKIAATIFGTDGKGKMFSLSRTNNWPAPIHEKRGTETRIGNSSGTIHAETAVILDAPCTQNASLCVTDPFCPNCAKNIAEAGIKTIYIDHKGFAKDFAARRGDDFEDMSMQICAGAGIGVYELRRKDKILVPILEAPANYVPAERNPALWQEIDNATPEKFLSLIEDHKKTFAGKHFALAFVRDNQGTLSCLAACAHPAIGLSGTGQGQGKYTFMLEPLNRLLMNAPRRGTKFIDGFIYSSCVPTAREQVNFVGAGLKKITIGDMSAARDEAAHEAMETLRASGIVAFMKDSAPL